MNEIAFIGDIHGCIEQLEEVVDSVAPRSSHLVFLGDYVDRGNSSRDVIEYLVCLQESERIPTTFLIGHHDQAFLSALTADGLDSFLRLGGASTIRSYVGQPETDIRAQLRRAVPDAHLAFLKCLVSHFASDKIIAAHDQVIQGGATVQRDNQFGIYGHRPQKSLVPRVESKRAFIDTGCGTLPGGRLTCLLWPSLSWVQSKSWEPRRPSD